MKKEKKLKEVSVTEDVPAINPADVSVSADPSAAESAEAKEKYRKQLIDEYNKSSENNTSIIDGEVTKEDIEEAEKAYTDEYNKVVNYKCTISDSSNSVRVAEFLKKWNAEDALWSKNYWQGTIKFDEFITGWLDKNRDEKTPQPLEIDLGALTYLYNIMGNPTGAGLASAVKMQSMNDQYNAIYNEIWDFYQDFTKEYKKLDALNTVVASRHQGWMMIYTETEPQKADASASESKPTDASE